MIPGELLVAVGDLEINAGRPVVTLAVANTGDRPVQVGSHYHFAETNAALAFDRAAARGFRLNIAAGTAVRFEPGQSRTVELVAFGGDRLVFGFRGDVMGPLDAKAGRRAAGKVAQKPSGSAGGKTGRKTVATGKPAAKRAPAAAARGRKR